MTMRCTTAREIMVASLDGAASDDEERRLAAHLLECETCAREREESHRLGRALAGLARESAVPQALEDAVMRRVRALGDERVTVADRVGAWLGVPAMLAGAAVATAVVVLSIGERATGPATSGPIARPRPVEVRTTQLVATEDATRESGGERAVRPDEKVRMASAAPETLPSDPPADLTASLPLLLDMPILRHMEKLENFERIEALTLVDDGGTSG